ncbi:protocadherin gamma-C5-like isoform X11 [Bufo bufo]|uniref:protocadherin gamma-C5-like isoform X11 n=1 Tax=Bufo bufo TaxID=8384 RepID=UPI001ABEB060|nr:protocadherin gamma-C5-like isoform X11 [Bufo bufo]
MDNQSFPRAWKWQVAFSLFLCSWGWVSGQLRYSIAEESHPGTVVGNVAQDLGVNLADISRRRLSLGSDGSSRLFSIEQKNGALVVHERVDRESLCGSSLSCLLHLEVVAENPLELHSLEIEVLDINDNSPIFTSTNQMIKIFELVTTPGVQFQLEMAKDADVGINDIKQYSLNPNPYFALSVTNRKDGTLIPELVLEKSLDREEIAEHKLILTAIDGGQPARSGSTQITVHVLDINDNAPVFHQSRYKVNLSENVPLQTVVIKLNATDLDEGSNGEILYSFNHHTLESEKQIFDLNPQTGEIFIKGTVDFEEAKFYELSVKAVDKGSPKLEGRCVVQIEIEDVNDNSPEINFISKNNEVPENAPIGTVVGFITVRDRDSGKNGEITLQVSKGLPFTCQPMSQRYALVTSGHLDREKLSQYTIKLTASDLGSPSLSSQITISLNISDVNDNRPAFLHNVYNAFIEENNEAGRLLCTVSATDPDEGANANLIYSITESHIHGSPVSSFVYINSDTGNIYAQRSFDYEQFQVLQITASVEDSGSPKLSSNVSVFIFILDTNDNSPTILYPEYTGETTAQETIPRSATAGYLVSKVSAVDVDSGHNAWLLYSLVESASPALFHISEYSGEVRTLRGLHETDNMEHRLMIAVSDHGEPSMTTTVTLIVNIMENIVHTNPRPQDFLTNIKPAADMTLYLIISLVAISVVSLVTFTILIVRCLRKETYGSSCGSCLTSRSHSNHYIDQYKPTLYLNTDGTLKYMEVRMAPPNAQEPCYTACFPPYTENDFTFRKPLGAPQQKVNEAESSTMNSMSEVNQAQPGAEWRFSQAQRPGPSGAQPAEEAGVWPNNQFETERLQAMILASANEAAEGTSGLGGGTGTMGLSARYGPQFTLQHVPDYRQNVYIPGSTLTPTNAGGKRDGKGGGNKKKSGKKEKK